MKFVIDFCVSLFIVGFCFFWGAFTHSSGGWLMWALLGLPPAVILGSYLANLLVDSHWKFSGSSFSQTQAS